MVPMDEPRTAPNVQHPAGRNEGLALLGRRELRAMIDSEREAGRAWSALAEACRLELALRTGQAS